MAAASKSLASESASPSGTFSYAQAAKGMASSNTTASQPSMPPSGTITPLGEPKVQATETTAAVKKDLTDALVSVDTSSSQQASQEQPGSEREAPVAASPQPTKEVLPQRQNEPSVISSPDFGTASSSNAGKEDDMSSVPNASSESTWENKSQTSNAVEMAAEAAQDPPADESVESTEAAKPAPKPLQEAPLPAVNVWKIRADNQAKARVSQPSVPAAKPTSAAPSAPTSNGTRRDQGDRTSDFAKPETRRKGRSTNFADGNESAPAERRHPGEAPYRRRDDDKPLSGRKETRQEGDGERSRKAGPSKFQEKEHRPAATVPLPPGKDQESWPTPEIAQDEGKKKSTEGGEKVEKDRPSPQIPRPHGKSEWSKLNFTPTVVFNTPMPNTTPRRGGRGGSRGGSQSNRGNHGANGTGATEKDGVAQAGHLNQEQPRRERPDNHSGRDFSPSKPRRAMTAGSPPPPRQPRGSGEGGERGQKFTRSENSSVGTRTFAPGESATSQYVQPSSGNAPRHQPSGRGKPRGRGDAASNFERRGTGEGAAVANEDAASNYSRRSSMLAPSDGNAFHEPRSSRGRADTGGKNTSLYAAENADRRFNPFADDQIPTFKPNTNERRNNAYGPVSARERGEGRGRGGSRGGRGGSNLYQGSHQTNGNHQYGSGPNPTVPQFQMPRSPTYHGEAQSPYFTPNSHHHPRGLRGGGSRSQSIPLDSPYGRGPNGYPSGGQGLPPIQTYANGTYDYPYMGPMSAVPYNPVMDQYQLANMVAMQLDYYFSVDNLCKDMFLRKHMDSKGFVFLTFIAEFNRIKQLTTDIDLIKHVAAQSRIIELRLGHDGKERLRRHEGWEQWVLAVPERDPSAQNDGPEEIHHPGTPYYSPYDQPQSVGRLPFSMSVPQSPGGLPHDSAFRSMNGFASAPAFTPNMHNGDRPVNGVLTEPSTPAIPSSHQPNPDAQNTQVLSNGPHVPQEVDSYPDEQVESLTVVVRKSDAGQLAAPKSAFTRSLSNGASDNRLGSEELRRVLSGGQQPNGHASNQGCV